MPKTTKNKHGFDGVVTSGAYTYLRFKQQSLVPLPPLGSAEFKPAYKAAVAAAKAIEAAKAPRVRREKPGGTVYTVRQAIDAYYTSPAYTRKSAGTRLARRQILEAWAKVYGDKLFRSLRFADYEQMLRNRTDRPGAAANWLSAVRAVIGVQIGSKLMKREENPTLGLVAPASNNPKGYKTWEREQLQMYRECWPSGTPQRLALEMLYHTGAACCDVIRLTRADIKDGLWEFDRQKTDVPALPECPPELEAEIAACQVQSIAGPLLRTATGLPFVSGRYFSATFQRWARAAGLPKKGYGAHGIRKRAATDDAETRWTVKELMAKYGWKRPDEAIHYTDAAENRRMMQARAAERRASR